MGGRPEDSLSSARQEGWENGGGERKEQMWVGGRCCLLIKCKCKADGTKRDLPNFWVCSLGGVWRGTSALGRSFLSTGSVLLAGRTRGQVTWMVRPGMRQHGRGRAQGHPKERRGVLATEGPGCRGCGLRAREGSGGRARNTGTGGQRMLGCVSLTCLVLPEDRLSSRYDPHGERGRVMTRQQQIKKYLI